MQTKPILAMAMVSMMIVPLALADSGKGKNGNGGGATTNADTRLIAKLRPTDPTIQEPLLEGHVVRRTQGTARDEFEARVEVPINLLGAVMPDELMLVAGSATCNMVLDKEDLVTGVAEYKTSIRSRNGAVPVSRAGSCTPAIPMVNANETASVTINGAITLQGQFITKR